MASFWQPDGSEVIAKREGVIREVGSRRSVEQRRTSRRTVPFVELRKRGLGKDLLRNQRQNARWRESISSPFWAAPRGCVAPKCSPAKLTGARQCLLPLRRPRPLPG